METLFEHAGGRASLRAFVALFYADVLADPLLGPLFGAGRPEHVDRLTDFESEVLGGPHAFTETLGFEHIIDVHRGLHIDEEQRARFVELFDAAADKAGLPPDEPFRRALHEQVEFGSHVAMQNSHARTDADLHDCRSMPYWDWPND